MFSILRLRQGCLYFHSYSNVWVNVLQKGLILSALEGAFITRQQGRQCCKEITQRHFLPAPWSLSLFRMAEISFQPSCPLHFHSGRGEKPKPWKEIIEEILLTCISACTEVSPWCLNTAGLEQWGRGRAHLSPSYGLLMQFYISVHHFAYSQRRINFLTSQASKTGLLRLRFGALVTFFQIWRKKFLPVSLRNVV